MRPQPMTPDARRSAPTEPWLIAGVSRGALSGLLAALLLGGLEVGVVAARSDLTGVALAVLGVYAAGVLSLLLVPWGMAVGVSLSARSGPEGGLSHWLNGLAMDEARDLAATQRLLGAMTWAATLTALSAWAASRGWLAALRWTDTLWALPLALLTSAALSAPLTRALGRVVQWLPLESLGRPHMTKVQGLFYVGALVAVAAWAPALLDLSARLDDPTVIFAGGLALFGPALMHGLLRRADAARTGHPFVLLLAWMALAVLSMRPISAFDQQPRIRDASYAHTAITHFALRWLGEQMGDRDGDGVPGLFGGPDCDDLDPAKTTRCDDAKP
jgi:hypothetical protein